MPLLKDGTLEAALSRDDTAADEGVGVALIGDLRPPS